MPRRHDSDPTPLRASASASASAVCPTVWLSCAARARAVGQIQQRGTGGAELRQSAKERGQAGAKGRAATAATGFHTTTLEKLWRCPPLAGAPGAAGSVQELTIPQVGPGTPC